MEQTLAEKNAKDQQESLKLAHKEKSRRDALTQAVYLRPHPDRSGTQPEYDVIKKAEEIYQWLIKDL